MMPNAFYSNDRKLNLAEYLEVLVAASFPETAFEPVEISKLRDEGECSLQIARDIPGTIFDSKIYLYLRKIGRING
jgi:hypothetical protein